MLVSFDAMRKKRLTLTLFLHYSCAKYIRKTNLAPIMIFWTFALSAHTVNKSEFNKHYTHQQLDHAIERLKKVLCHHKDKMSYKILVMVLYDLNVTNLRAKEWLHEEPVYKLIKYDLPLTLMEASDPWIYEFINCHNRIHLTLLNHKSSDSDIENAWEKWDQKFKERSKEMNKVRQNFMKAFKIDESNPGDQWIRHHLHNLVAFKKDFWEKHKNHGYMSDLADGMIALHEDRIHDATKYLKAYKEAELKRLPSCKDKK